MPNTRTAAQQRKRRVRVSKAAPFPVPITTVTGESASNKNWIYYTAFLSHSGVVVKHTGDMSFLYKMGFFGKGGMSRGQPQWSEHWRHVNCWWPESNHSKEKSVRTKVTSRRRYMTHLQWSMLAAGDRDAVLKVKADQQAVVPDARHSGALLSSQQNPDQPHAPSQAEKALTEMPESMETEGGSDVQDCAEQGEGWEEEGDEDGGMAGESSLSVSLGDASVSKRCAIRLSAAAESWESSAPGDADFWGTADQSASLSTTNSETVSANSAASKSKTPDDSLAAESWESSAPGDADFWGTGDNSASLFTSNSESVSANSVASQSKTTASKISAQGGKVFRRMEQNSVSLSATNLKTVQSRDVRLPGTASEQGKGQSDENLASLKDTAAASLSPKKEATDTECHKEVLGTDEACHKEVSDTAMACHTDVSDTSCHKEMSDQACHKEVSVTATASHTEESKTACHEEFSDTATASHKEESKAACHKEFSDTATSSHKEESEAVCTQNETAEDAPGSCSQKEEEWSEFCLGPGDRDCPPGGALLVTADSDDEEVGGDGGRVLTTQRKWRPCVKADPFPVEENLHLSYEEAYFLSYGLGCLTLLDSQQRPMDLQCMWTEFCQRRPDFLPTYVAYHHYRSHNWVPKTGLKFGCSFLLYKDGPPFFHGSYSVVVKFVDAEGKAVAGHGEQRQFSWTSLAGLKRITEHVGKELLFCYVIKPRDMTAEEMTSPDCVPRFQVKEMVVSRWVSSQEREGKALEDIP